MERSPSSPLDLDAAGILVANFLQSWRHAGLAVARRTSNRRDRP